MVVVGVELQINKAIKSFSGRWPSTGALVRAPLMAGAGPNKDVAQAHKDKND